MKEKVAEIIDMIRPAIQGDGGDIQLVDVSEDDGVVTVHLMGACQGCPSANITLKQGIEATLKERVPGVTRVDAV